MSLIGKIAAITGATSGIGLECTKAFLDAGAKVVLIHYSAEKLAKVCKTLGPKAIPLAMDVTDQEMVDDMVPKILEKAGGLDIFIANAGRFIGGTVAEGDPEAWKDMVEINVNAVHSNTQAALQYMLEKKRGDIVVTSSIAGHKPFGLCPVYCATKAANEFYLDSLRDQIAGSGVRVMSILPGPVETKLLEDWPADQLAAARAGGEFLLPKDVAESALFMVSRKPGMTITKLIVMPTGSSP